MTEHILKEVDDKKYLGITINGKLKWNKQDYREELQNLKILVVTSSRGKTFQYSTECININLENENNNNNNNN